MHAFDTSRVTDNSLFHMSSWKVTKLLHETEAKVDLAQLGQLEKWNSRNNKHANKFRISTSLTVRG